MINHSWLSSFRLLLVLTSIMVAALPAAAQGDSPVTVRIAPVAIDIPLGQTTDVAVEVVAAQDIYGFDLALTFDPAVVEIVDADPNQSGVQNALGTFLDSGFVVMNTADNASGTLRFVMTQLNPSLPKSGTGTLIVIRLRGKEVNGGTPLTLTAAQLARRDGRVLSTNPISGQVSVVASAGSSPTRTPIPTQGAGTPMPTSSPATAAPTTSGEAVQPTPASLATGSTITPNPTKQPAATAFNTPTQSAVASATPESQSNNTQNSETLQPTTVSSASQPIGTANTPAAVAAVATSPVPVNATVVTQVPPAAATPAGSSGSAMTLVALAGVVGLIGIATVWFVTRRRSQ